MRNGGLIQAALGAWMRADGLKLLDAFRCAYVRMDWDSPERRIASVALFPTD